MSTGPTRREHHVVRLAPVSTRAIGTPRRSHRLRPLAHPRGLADRDPEYGGPDAAAASDDDADAAGADASAFGDNAAPMENESDFVDFLIDVLVGLAQLRESRPR